MTPPLFLTAAALEFKVLSNAFTFMAVRSVKGNELLRAKKYNFMFTVIETPLGNGRKRNLRTNIKYHLFTIFQLIGDTAG